MPDPNGVPPPSASPMHPLPAEEPTDPSIRAVRPYVEEALKKHDNKLTIRSLIVAVGAVATGVAAVLLFLDNRVSAQVKEETRVAQAEQKALDARTTTLEKRFDRFDAKMDALLDANGVPAWKRPPPLSTDGGR